MVSTIANPHLQTKSTAMRSFHQQLKDQPDPTVILRLPYNLSIQELVDVMQLGATHQYKMVLATTKK